MAAKSNMSVTLACALSVTLAGALAVLSTPVIGQSTEPDTPLPPAPSTDDLPAAPPGGALPTKKETLGFIVKYLHGAVSTSAKYYLRGTGCNISFEVDGVNTYAANDEIDFLEFSKIEPADADCHDWSTTVHKIHFNLADVTIFDGYNESKYNPVMRGISVACNLHAPCIDLYDCDARYSTDAYCSSATAAKSRAEVMFPIQDDSIRARLLKAFAAWKYYAGDRQEPF
jgi:hypothetical protein